MLDCERHVLYCGTNCREFVFCEAFKELLQAIVGQGLCLLIFYKNLSQKHFLKRLCSRAFSFGLFKVYCLSIKLFQRVTWNEYCYCWFYFQRKFISIENRLIRSPYTLTHFVISPVSAYRSIIYKINLYVTKINSNKSFFWWWKCCIFIQNFENLVIHYAFIKRN